MAPPLPARIPLRSRRILIAIGTLAVAIAALQLAAASRVGGLVVCAMGALGGLVLWLRSNRTVATAVMSTGVTMMWIPAVIDRVGRAAGVPTAIAGWEVVPMWALTLAVPAGAWLAARHTGSRAVTVLLCHLAISVAAVAAAVFPASAISAAAALTLAILILRSGAPDAVRATLRRIRAHGTEPPEEVRDARGRLWFAIRRSDESREIYVGAGGRIAVLHRMPPGRVTLDRVDEAGDAPVRAYALNGSATELARILQDFAVADRTLARSLSIDTRELTTLVAAPAAHLSSDTVRIDLAGAWDAASHRYVDHCSTLLASAGAEEHLHDLAAGQRRRRWGTRARREARYTADMEHGDRRQRRVAATAMALR